MSDKNKFILIGDVLFLDFVNTKVMRRGEPHDLLDSYGDFAAWSRAVGLNDREGAGRLLDRSRDPERELSEVRRFRDHLRELAERIVGGRRIGRGDVEELNRKLALRDARPQLRRGKEGFRIELRTDHTDPEQILAEVAGSAAEVLAGNGLGNIRKCESDDCILYFYDTTKNRSRRWCSMKACGNRAKASAFYKRRKAARDD